MQLTGLAVTPRGPYLMRSHFISSAPGRSPALSSKSSCSRAKLQRPETIISVITKALWVSPRRDPSIPARGHLPTVLSDFLYSHARNMNNHESADRGPEPMFCYSNSTFAGFARRLALTSSFSEVDSLSYTYIGKGTSDQWCSCLTVYQHHLESSL